METFIKTSVSDFPGGPVVKTLHVHFREHCLTPAWGTSTCCATQRGPPGSQAAILPRPGAPTTVQVQRPPQVSLGWGYPRGQQARLWCYLRGPGVPPLPQHVHGCRGHPPGLTAWPPPLFISGEKQAPNWPPFSWGSPRTPSALSSQRSQISKAASSLREGPQPRRSPA